MYYPLMFDIELFTFAKVNFTRSTEKASQMLFKHAKNGGKGQGTQLEHKAATWTDRRCVVLTLVDYNITCGNEKHREATKHVDSWAIEPRSLTIQPKNAWKNASTAALVTSTACKFSGYASDTGHKLVISCALGKYQNRALGLGFDISLVLVYNLNIYLL